MLRPITPFVEYAINYDYISKVLCINKDKPDLGCNGKCQLMKKLEKQQDDDFKSLRINIEEYPIGFVELLSVKEEKVLFNNAKQLFSYNNKYSYLFSNTIFHPPTV